MHWPLFIIKHLPKFGWQPVVLTADQDSFSHKDNSLLKEIDPSLVVEKTASNEPFHLYRKFLGKSSDSPLIASEAISLENKDWKHRLSIWIRMNLFVPDARIGWNFSAMEGAKRILKKHKIDAIISVGPPHSSHLIAKKLSKRYALPHIPVLIDPWVDIVYYKNFKRNPITLKLDNYFERSTLSQAMKIIFVTKSAEEEYGKKYPWIAGKSDVLYWGYNEEYFEGKSKKKTSASKTILHAGNIFDYQNPLPLLKSIKREITQGKQLNLRFVGTVGQGIKASVSELGLDSITEYKGFLKYSDVVQEMLDADFLLVCASEKRHTPGKLFEYLRTGNTIIAFGDDNAEVNDILGTSRAGKLFPYHYERDDIFQQLKDTTSVLSGVKQFSREKIAESLAQILNGIAE